MTAPSPWIVGLDEPVLVTGASGFIGSRTVEALLERGFRHVRLFVRPSSDGSRLQQLAEQAAAAGGRLSIVEGNLLSPRDCAAALEGSRVVFHLAAGIDTSFASCFMNSVLTTRNLLDAVVAAGGVKRFVNVSSFAVYSNLAMKRGELLDETAPLESEPNRRHDPYGYGKLKQEQLVADYGRRYQIPYVTLRPGAVFGPGKASLSGRIGIDTFGVFLHLGGSNRIPFTYVDNCAEAIVLAGLVDGIDGEAFNIVDDDLPTSRRFLGLYKKHVRRFTSVPVPYSVASLLCALWESYSERSEGQLPPRFNRRRCAAEWKGNRYSNAKLKRMIGWTPRVPFDVACRKYFESLHAS